MEGTTVVTILEQLAAQQEAAVMIRDQYWEDYWKGKNVAPPRMVTAPDESLKPSPADQPTMIPPTVIHAKDWTWELPVAQITQVQDVVRILKGAMNQKTIAAALPMLRSAVERLENLR